MWGHFSIEWMAQSSQTAATDPAATPAPTACGTDAESLPGFYCRPKSQSGPQQERHDARKPDLRFYGPSNSSMQQPGCQVGYVVVVYFMVRFLLAGSEAGFSSGTEEETSGYESEGEHSISPSAHNTDIAPTSLPSTPPSGRRPRTAFTAEQISSLERAFKRNAYLGTQDKAELCKKLNLSDKQIRNWFQNRRMKLKRTVQDALAHACQANTVSHFTPYSELQAFRPAPYSRYHLASPQDTAATFAHPHGLQYASPLPSAISSLPLDSLYQYGGLPATVLPAATPTPLMGPYPAYSQYY
ncbi:ventrally expressed dharma/bozozok antagonist [Dunckerocampus dactyliophorus]|uniref:ventrally expressed dharma/bozozok antagonist n=1 Tax=Dunckerocampus dactyliophorus TaxID=161453 RepID=UPI00240598F3|nr:ventrally expressed dharma/bozozok antagonist [Dunckerocampus dactyliophorus]